jgi:hypothetical protein
LERTRPANGVVSDRAERLLRCEVWAAERTAALPRKQPEQNIVPAVFIFIIIRHESDTFTALVLESVP